MLQPTPDPALLLELQEARIHFGKYKGRLIMELPEAYLGWFVDHGGYPPGRLGELMATAHIIKMYDLEHLIGFYQDDRGGVHRRQ